MTNDNSTRKKANAVFFAAIMVVSMVAVGFAAAPAAAANVDTADYDRDAGTESGLTLYQGQEVIYDISDFPEEEQDNLELRELDTSGDTTQVGGLEAALDPEGGDHVVIDTSNREAGQYVITTQSNGDEFNTTEGDIRFEVVVQDLTTEFDEDTVGDSGEDSTVDFEIDSDARNTYAVNIEADGLDEGDLEDIFNGSDDATFTNDVTENVDTDDDGEYDRYNVSTWANDDSAATGDYALNEEDGYITLFFAEGDHELDFTDIDADEYEFETSVVDTTAEDTDSITVEDIGDGDINIEESSITQQQGDSVEFTVTADGAASTGTVVVGGEDDFGYQANVNIDDFGDDDEITLRFNTYTAGINNTSVADEPVEVVDTDDDDDEITFENETELDDILATGDYDISSSASSNFDDTVDSSDDVATLFIEERSTDGIQLWTTSDSTASDVLDEDDEDQLETLTTAVEDGDVTQTETFAHDDTSVHQISASGLQGALDWAGQQDGVSSDDESEQLEYLLTEANNTERGPNDDNALSFTIDETSESAGPNSDGIEFTPDADDIDVIVDEENDDYYVVLDTSNIDEVENDEDYEFDVEFTVQDSRLLNADEDDDADDFEDSYSPVSAMLSLEERTAEFDQDPYNVSNSDSETVTGTTNVAPGTEFTVRARSDSGTQPSFVKTNDEVNVSEDGTFEAEFDFSDTSVGDEFTLTVQQLGLNDAVEADGTVVEQVDEAGATFEVSELDPEEATATAGDSVTVSATIENTGDSEGTQDVALTLDGEELDSQEVTLGSGEDTTVEFTADTTDLEAGDYTHGIATDDDEQTGTLTIEAASDDGGDDDSSEDDSSEDDSSEDDSSEDDSSEDGETEDDTPGFGAIVALVALIAAALLATRRNE